MARIVVCGYMVRHPLAGNVLAFFQYVLGLHRLGHEVLYLEESGWPDSCYDPETHDYGDDPHTGLQVVRRLMEARGTEIPVCYVNRDSAKVEGAEWCDVKRWLATADLLLNIGGVCWLPEFRLCRRRALIDMDPFFTQVGRFGAEGLHDHDVYFSYGTNIGRTGCTIPSDGIEWQPTVPPVVLGLWEGGQAPADAPFTTIANWSGYGGLTYRGQHYGQKDEEFLRVLDLPRRTPQTLELALSGAGPDVVERLRAAGWAVRDAAAVSTDMAAYRAYIAGSRGEFSVAKNAYVKTRSGWVSDRSVCYLASGRPVLVQDTGVSEWLPVGEGLLTFDDVSQAAEGLAAIDADYERHSRAARRVAEQYFAAERVLPPLVEMALS